MTIVEQTLREIAEQRCLSNIKVSQLYLRSPFTVVVLSDGSVGSAMNHGYTETTSLSDCIADESCYTRFIDSDPLLLDRLSGKRDIIGESIFVSIVSALSQPLMNSETLSNRGLSFDSLNDWGEQFMKISHRSRIVTLIGYGGAISLLLRNSSIESLFISDLIFSNSETLYKAYADLYSRVKRFNFKGQITLIDGGSQQQYLERSELVVITGSALTNQTMESILFHSAESKAIVVQGPSASIFPTVLFRYGVTDLFIPLKESSQVELGSRRGRDILNVVDNNYIKISARDI